MVYLLWLFFGILTGALASSKKRNVVSWGLAGVLGGIFAFLILLVLPKIEVK